MTGSTPSEMMNLRLILVSGKTKEFLFSPNDSAADIAKHVYDNWPMDWEEEQVSSPNILRLIYQGRFLHGNVTLGALKLPLGKSTVMHLVARETLPEPNSQGQRNREKTGESNCCVILNNLVDDNDHNILNPQKLLRETLHLYVGRVLIIGWIRLQNQT
uniref:Ubiquitin-like protein 3 n=3 Tax=Oncorhynchus mykiss TaxID=8022 RepID=A0A8L0DJI6_ONCMY